MRSRETREVALTVVKGMKIYKSAVLVCTGYRDKMPQTWRLKTRIFSQLWRLDIQEKGDGMVVSGENSHLGLQVCPPSHNVLVSLFLCAHTSLVSFSRLIRMTLLLV